jgi:hypothetical protein
MPSKMERCAFVTSLLVALITVAIGPKEDTAVAAQAPAQTKAQTEVNILRAIPRTRRPRWVAHFVDPRSHLLVNNTQVICHGRGPRHSGGRYERFACVVQARRHARRLYASYRALRSRRFVIHWLAYKR